MKLNYQQLHAINTKSNHVLVLAVPGSGKTTVLVNRVMRLLEDGISPMRILCITFTRKAAQEMKDRIKELTDDETMKKMTIGTSHSFCLSILRKWHDKIGLSETFSIYNPYDKRDILESIIAEGKHKISVKKMLDFYARGEAVGDKKQKTEISNIDLKYRRKLKKFNAVDFDMILSLAVQILNEHPEVLQYYRDRYGFLFYDEFHDVAKTEDRLCLTLAIRNTFVVGDVDQNLYSWRGTSIEYILKHKEKHPDLETIHLQYNYRSVPGICQLANNLIEHNKDRVDKKIVPVREAPPEPSYSVYMADNGNDEVLYLKEQIKAFVAERGYEYKDIAILTRTNSQIDRFREGLGDIPYQVVSRDSYWDKEEVRNTMLYLRVILNPDDDYIMGRILRLPHLRIDKIELQSMRSIAIEEGVSLFKSIEETAVTKVLEIYGWEKDIEDMSVDALVEKFIKKSLDTEGGFLNSFKEQELKTRLDNVNRLVKYKIPDFLEREEGTDLRSFLDSVVQIEATDKIKKNDDKVSLMTVHCAKGLEWPVVMIPGFEEGTFPVTRKTEKDLIEEERRIAYVAATRAKDLLLITLAKERTGFTGRVIPKVPSRFLKEMGIENEG